MTCSRTATQIARQIKARTLAVAIATCFAPVVLANPVGPTVVNGAATFATTGNTFAITNTPGAIINWQQFNIGQNEITRFIQQSQQSAVLNRVTGQDPSQIFGALQSNGRVLLINPNGTVFGPNASVDVFGLVVSNLNLGNADFLAGRYNFNGGGNGSILNQGAITTPVGGSVYLIGSNVANTGLITSPSGQVLLAAGNSVSLADTGTPNMSVTLNASGNQAVNLGTITAAGGSIDIYGALINQQGIVSANSQSVDAQGRVTLKATDTTTVSGTVSATNSQGAGGQVNILGDKVALTSTANIDVSGVGAGGTALIGGDQSGKNAAVQNAGTTTIAAGSTIKADAIDSGNGGKVIVWSNDKTTYDGFISARGGANGGDGGFVETSGKTLANNGRVDTTAAKGSTGNWLLDPASYCFFISSSTECSSTGFNASNGTATSNLDSLLLASNATLAATDYVAYLPAGGSYQIGASVPAGRTLTVQAPYIYFGKGSILSHSRMNLNLSASNQYGTSSFAGKTGVIDILGGIFNEATGSQTLTATGDINIGGPGITDSAVTFSMRGTQTVTAGGNINIFSPGGIIPGSGPNPNDIYLDAGISSGETQIVSANNINISVGTATNNPTGNISAFIFSAPSFSSTTPAAPLLKQTVTATGAINITGGSAGTGNVAGIVQGLRQSSTTASGGEQVISAGQINLKGGSAGANNAARILQNRSDAVTNLLGPASQTINAAQIKLAAGVSGSGNAASIGAAGTQNITLTGSGNVLTLTAGGSTASDFDDYASIIHSSATSGSQAITFTGTNASVVLEGGAGSSKNGTVPGDCTACAGNTSANFASIHNSFGNQTLDFQHSGSITMLGGRSGNYNQAYILENATSGTQSIGSSAGSANYPTITLYGGTSGGAYVSNTWGSSWLSNTAGIRSNTDQTIQAASMIVQGVNPAGATGPVFGGAGITASGATGAQTITVNGALQMTAGDGKTANPSSSGARIHSQSSGAQNITAQSLTLAGAVSGSSNSARIEAINGPQNITLTGSSGTVLSLTGGGNGPNDYGNAAEISHGNNSTGSNAGNQTITISNGGSVTLTGGKGSGTSASLGNEQGCTSTNPCPVSRNGAEINNSSTGAQTLDFLAGGSLNLTGGTTGSKNWAHIWSQGSQTVSSSKGAANYPALTLTGGSGGYVDSVSGADLTNSAGMNTDSLTKGLQTVNASTIAMSGGGTATTFGGAWFGSDGGTTVTTTGNLTLTGGASNLNPVNNTNLKQADFTPGSSAGISSASSLKASIGGDLILTGGSGAGAPVLLGSDGTLEVTVGGATRMSAGNAQAVIASGSAFQSGSPLAAVSNLGGLAWIAAPTGSFNTRSLSVSDAKNVVIGSPVAASEYIELHGDAIFLNAPVTAGKYFASVAGTFDLNSTITANGDAFASYFGAPASASGKYLQAGIWTSEGFTNHGGTIKTPNGYWVVVLDPGVTGATDAIGVGPMPTAELLGGGYHWASATAEASATGDYHFYAPTRGSSSTSQVISQAASDTCATNALLCTTTATVTQAIANAATTVGASTAQAQITYDDKAKPADAKPADAKAAEAKPATEGSTKAAADTKPAAVASTAAAQPSGKTVLASAQAADARKSSVELKAEAQKATSEAKQITGEAKQATAEAKQAVAAVKVAAVEAKKAETQAKAADTTARKADAEVKQAEAEVKAAKTPEQKVQAETRKTQAEAKRSEAEAKKAEAEAKKPEVEAKQATAEAKQVSAEAKQAQAAAKQAEGESKQAAAQAKEAKTPEQKVAAERRADDKRVEAIQHKATAGVKQTKAETKQAEAEVHQVKAEAKKSEAAARQAEAEVKHVQVDKAPAKRIEAEVKKAEVEVKKVEVEVRKVQAEVKKADAEVNAARTPEQKVAAANKHKAAESRKAEAESKLAEHKAEAQTKKSELAKASDRKGLVEAKKAEADGKQKTAEAKKAEAETKVAAHERRQAVRRAETVKAFAKTMVGSMSYEKLAEIAAVRHEMKTEILKPALTILEKNPKAADLPPCGAGSDLCVPTKAAVADAAGRQAAQVAAGALPKPTVAFVPQIERKIAVLVGINKYADSAIPALESAVPDVEAVAQVMQQKLGYEVRIVRDGTKADIVKAMKDVGSDVGPNDSVTVYYAGHGYLMEAGDTKTGYWIPSDGTVTSPKQWLSSNDIGKLLANIPAKQVLLVSDSCYSGSLAQEGKVGAGSGKVQDILSKRSVTVMSSGGEEPVSDEGKDGHSIFAWSLMNSLGKVNQYESGEQLYGNVKQGVIESFPQVPQYGAATSAGHAVGGDYLLEVRSYK